MVGTTSYTNKSTHAGLFKAQLKIKKMPYKYLETAFSFRRLTFISSAVQINSKRSKLLFHSPNDHNNWAM